MDKNVKIKELDLTLEEKNLIFNINKNLENSLYNNFSLQNQFFKNFNIISYDENNEINKKLLNNFENILNSSNYFYKEYLNKKNNINNKQFEFILEENSISKEINSFNFKLNNISKLFVEKEKSESLNFLNNIKSYNNKDLESKFINLHNKNLDKLNFLVKDNSILKIKSLENDFKLIKNIKNLNSDVKKFKKKHKWFWIVVIFLNIMLLGVFLWILIIII
ncbi:hypothetical protein X271_00091 [Candidatus Hepatoplasma crinochetorum Av]|uniref:Uncharacterized protein n=1 Tax=Candidatus Hepatoplasma crinochetorum Av TaxID=1427984 RepID=W8GEH0_9MOLU|nr:hypothetical protein [Candidatus Hepatoplasma crinochetorum]AHK22204.1 hypothetical protein X271_00091 [Candidatus Hepatoplasma crinochetorum Av]